jgi:hypothetical protein
MLGDFEGTVIRLSLDDVRARRLDGDQMAHMLTVQDQRRRHICGIIQVVAAQPTLYSLSSGESGHRR